MIGSSNVLPICPEVLGGLSIPRPPSEIERGNGGDVLDGKAKVKQLNTGIDLTAQFIKGAEVSVEIAEKEGIDFAIFKERSPSCGVKFIYNGEKVVEGMGVTTEALVRRGFRVFSDENFKMDFLGYEEI